MGKTPGGLLLAAMLLLPAAGYYATFATFGIETGPLLGSGLAAGAATALIVPSMYRQAHRGQVPFWHLLAIAVCVPILSFLTELIPIPGNAGREVVLPRLGLNLLLVAPVMWSYLRLERAFRTRPSPIVEEGPKIHRIEPFLSEAIADEARKNLA
jgi:hypothetical protein